GLVGGPAVLGGRRQRRELWPELGHLLAEQRRIVASRQPDDLKLIRVPRHDVERLATDRAGGAEDGDAFPFAHDVVTTKKYAPTPANKTLSMRSSTPPCPGIRSPESLAPHWRLMNDSIRSPAMAQTPITSPRPGNQSQPIGPAMPGETLRLDISPIRNGP